MAIPIGPILQGAASVANIAGGIGGLLGGGGSGNPLSDIPTGLLSSPIEVALGQQIDRLTRPPAAFPFQMTAPLSNFQLAAGGQIAQQALLGGAPMPTTGTAAFGGAPLSSVVLGPGGLPMGAAAPSTSVGSVPQQAAFQAPMLSPMMQGAVPGFGPQGFVAQGVNPAAFSAGSVFPANAPPPFGERVFGDRGLQLQSLGGELMFSPFQRLPAASGFINPMLAPLFSGAGISPIFARPNFGEQFAGQFARNEFVNKVVEDILRNRGADPNDLLVNRADNIIDFQD